jgi:hypothetical protein
MLIQTNTNYIKGLVFMLLSDLVNLPEQQPHQYMLLTTEQKDTIRKLRELNSVDLMALTTLLTSNASFVVKMMSHMSIQESLNDVNQSIDEVLVNKNLNWFLSNGSSVGIIHDLFMIKNVDALEFKKRQGRPCEPDKETEAQIKCLLQKYRFFERKPITAEGKIKTQAFFMSAVVMFGSKYSVSQIEGLLEEALFESTN